LFKYIFFKQDFSNMLSFKHFLFINMLLFYIEDKNHF